MVSILDGVYRTSLALATDFYQLTMAAAYWKSGLAERESVFNLHYRKNPFGGGFALACGLQTALEYLERFRFDKEDVSYLGSLKGADEKPIFEAGFLDYLRDLRLSLDVDAIAEGTPVFPNEPLLRVRGSLLQAQLVETALLNIINFQTLIATKAARVSLAARGESVLEFGLRRAQGIDGGLSASRAAFIGGCDATSNVLAGRHLGIPVRGTHAHSWVMAFEDEEEAFEAYARALPNNCLFLVDTYDTLEGVRKAISVGRRLKERGNRLLGIRLDSGDLAHLSIEARKLLDDAGFPDAKIVASNDLDEGLIASLKEQGAKIAVWGVGTKLATAYDQPALGGVYKLSAMREPEGRWRPVLKISEQAAKTSIPGIQQVRRYRDAQGAVCDVIYDTARPVPEPCILIDPLDSTRRKVVPADASFEDLLIPVLRKGKISGDLPSLVAIRQRAAHCLADFHSGVKRFTNPHQYPVGLEKGLHDLRNDLILKKRGLEKTL